MPNQPAHITAWQADFYARSGFAPPPGALVQASELINEEPVFIDTAPTFDARTYMQAMESEEFLDEVTGVNPTLERMITSSTPSGYGLIGQPFIENEIVSDPPPNTSFTPLAVTYELDKINEDQIIPMELKPPIPAPSFIDTVKELGSQLMDPFGIFSSSDGSGPDINFTQSGAGGAGMMMGIQGVSKLAVMFSGIGNVISKTNGRIPLGKGFMSRVGQIFAGLGVADIIGLGNPFNNQSDTDQVQDMIVDALESGAISDNRAFNRATNEMMPLQAVVILYDRMGRDVERMYAVSFRPANPQAVRRRSIRSNNVIRRRRTPARRSR